LTHAPTRLSIVSLLAASEWADEAGYVEIRKGFVGKRPRTTAGLTRAGRTAFERHVAALQKIVARSGASILP
jgi:hypothetical protein